MYRWPLSVMGLRGNQQKQTKWSLDLVLKSARCMLSEGRCGKKPYAYLGRMSGQSNRSKRQQKRPSNWRNKLLQKQPKRSGVLVLWKGGIHSQKRVVCMGQKAWRTTPQRTRPLAFLQGDAPSGSEPTYRQWSLFYRLSHSSFQDWCGLYQACFSIHGSLSFPLLLLVSWLTLKLHRVATQTVLSIVTTVITSNLI
jgi:hypothetical protein